MEEIVLRFGSKKDAREFFERFLSGRGEQSMECYANVEKSDHWDGDITPKWMFIDIFPFEED